MRPGGRGICTGDNIHFEKFPVVIKQRVVYGVVVFRVNGDSSSFGAHSAQGKRRAKLRKDGKSRSSHNRAYAPCGLQGPDVQEDRVFGCKEASLLVAVLLLQRASIATTFIAKFPRY